MYFDLDKKYMKKYQIIEEWIREQITQGEGFSNQKLPSESQLCSRFGVSRNAVRHALRNLTDEGLLKSIKGVGTFCVQREGIKTNTIGFVGIYSGSYIFPKIIQGCDQVLFQDRYHLIVHQTEYNLKKEKDILFRLMENNISGIIIQPFFTGSGDSNKNLLKEFKESGLPIVLLDNNFPDEDFNNIILDDREGGRMAASYLMEKGHKKVGIFYENDYYPKLMRKEGAEESIEAAGLKMNKDWLIGFKGQGPEGRSDAARHFFSNTKTLPTAIFCTNDEEALILIEEAEKHGIKVPADLSVMGFDDSDIAKLEKISLTSMEHPSAYMGEMAAKLVMQGISTPKKDRNHQIIIRPNIVERCSVRDVNT